MGLAGEAARGRAAEEEKENAEEEEVGACEEGEKVEEVELEDGSEAFGAPRSDSEEAEGGTVRGEVV